MSKVHVKVEHAISGIKRSQSVKYILRNTKDNFSGWPSQEAAETVTIFYFG